MRALKSIQATNKVIMCHLMFHFMPTIHTDRGEFGEGVGPQHWLKLQELKANLLRFSMLVSSMFFLDFYTFPIRSYFRITISIQHIFVLSVSVLL